MTCGPSATVRVLDACTGEPLPGAKVYGTSLGPYTPYPSIPELVYPCGAIFEREVIADSEGDALLFDLRVVASQVRVTVSAGTPGTSDARYNQVYLTILEIDAPFVTVPAFPVAGICPPVGEPGGGSGGGDCAECGAVPVFTDPVSTWPQGSLFPEGYKGFGFLPGNERCHASTARVPTLQALCYPDVGFILLPDAYLLHGPEGSSPLPWNAVGGSVVDGSATAAMVAALLQNQDLLRAQNSWMMNAIRALAVHANDMSAAINPRLSSIYEVVQLLGTALFGEGWSDRTHVTRDDPWAAAHPIILEEE